MMNQTKQHGFNLVELMVAMVIGVFLIAGALRVYTQSQAALLVSEQSARLQETARYALSVIEQDIRAVGLWGLTNEADDIANRGAPGDTTVFTVDDSCFNNYAVDLDAAILGANNANPTNAPCVPPASYQANSDQLLVRHAQAAEVTGALETGRLYVQSDANSGAVFVGPNAPTSPSVEAIITPLTSNLYWVSSSSDNDAQIPSLRRNVLGVTGTSTAVIDEEVIAGVEDLQIQYGVDNTGDGSVDIYDDFDNIADPSQIMVVRVWLRVRALNQEVGFIDDATYVYSDNVYVPGDLNDESDRYRRLLVTKTIELRNRRLPDM